MKNFVRIPRTLLQYRFSNDYGVLFIRGLKEGDIEHKEKNRRGLREKLEELIERLKERREPILKPA